MSLSHEVNTQNSIDKHSQESSDDVIDESRNAVRNGRRNDVYTEELRGDDGGYLTVTSANTIMDNAHVSHDTSLANLATPISDVAAANRPLTGVLTSSDRGGANVHPSKT